MNSASLSDVPAIHRRLQAPLAVCSALAVLLPLIFSVIAYGQSTFGRLVGTVTDPSGSSVPNAKVTLLNTGTNVSRTAVSNTAGSYEFVNVEVGNYKLHVEATGFQRTSHDWILP